MTFLHAVLCSLVLVSYCREALTVVDDLKMCLSEIEFSRNSTCPPIELIDPNVAQIYIKSYRSKVCQV